MHAQVSFNEAECLTKMDEVLHSATRTYVAQQQLFLGEVISLLKAQAMAWALGKEVTSHRESGHQPFLRNS